MDVRVSGLSPQEEMILEVVSRSKVPVSGTTIWKKVETWGKELNMTTMYVYLPRMVGKGYLIFNGGGKQGVRGQPQLYSISPHGKNVLSAWKKFRKSVEKSLEDLR